MFYGFDVFVDSLIVMEVYSGSIKSWMGYYNDCFLVVVNDFIFGNIEMEKFYWEMESWYIIMGGEFCGDNFIYMNCVNVFIDLENVYWVYFNDYYYFDVLDCWVVEGCLFEIKRWLGYCLFLEKGIYEIIVVLGINYYLILDIWNEGFVVLVNL